MLSVQLHLINVEWDSGVFQGNMVEIVIILSKTPNTCDSGECFLYLKDSNGNEFAVSLPHYRNKIKLRQMTPPKGNPVERNVFEGSF